MTKFEVLEKHFGHTSFRPSQESVIDALLSKCDVLGIMPTGAGKSLCYQVPAILFEGVTLVVSPLISLMKDQVFQLRRRNIPAAFINSSLTKEQYHEVLRRMESGQYKIIYVAPERLATEDFLKFAVKSHISLIAVDEAHCVSQWGQDFRPSYLNIAEFVSKLKNRPVVGAYTATATKDVQKDIISLLKLNDPFSITTGFDRPNLYFGVERQKSKHRRFFEMIDERRDECGVVYCSTRKTVDSISAELSRRGFNAGRYHAGMEDAERRINQDKFIQNEVSVIVATNAFGMGIDKPDVRYVFHYNMPKNLESYYQEAGRAGRDGNKSDCILLYSDDDIDTAEYFLDNSGQNSKLTERERRKVQRLDMMRLDRMIRYCEINSCLRSYILSYFGEKYKGKCGYCSSCNRPRFIDRIFSL